MKPEDALTIMKIDVPDATLEHAAAFLALAEDRGLTPFIECHPILTAKREEVGGKWITTGKKVTIKEHYNIAARWAQKCGGYSTPVREVSREERQVKVYGKLQKKPGVKVRVGVITNRDYAALMDLARMGIPGFNFSQERDAFIKWGEAWVADDHAAPSGKDSEWVARKRATEEALLNAFGREPSQARQMYAAALTAEVRQEAAALMYPEEPARKALPAPTPSEAQPIIEGEYVDGFDPDADYEALQRAIEGEAQRYAEADKPAEQDYIDAVEFGVFKSAKGKLHIGFMAEGEKWPSVRWWEGREKFIEAAPWIGTGNDPATKDALAEEGRRWSCAMRVYFEMDGTGNYKNAVRFVQA